MSHEPSPRSEIQELKSELAFMRRRLDAMARRLETLEAEEKSREPEAPISGAAPTVIEVPPVIASPPPAPMTAAEPLPVAVPAADTAVPPVGSPPVVVSPPPPLPSSPPVPKESFEVRLGTYWLPRIGMALLLTGMVFLVTWSYHYMGAAGKVALSYLCCAALGALGGWLEKRAGPLARVLQAGALALTYFVTYAMHYVEAFRLIESPGVALALLMVVAAGIVWIADRRQSAALAGMALFFGYYTSVMSGVATFTLAANAMLAAAALVLLIRNRWVPISYGAVFATYLVYALWAWKFSNWRELEKLVFDTGYLTAEQFRLRAMFLSLYWGLFTVGGLVTSRDTLRAAERTGLLTLNNAFLFVLFSMLMHHAHPEWQWVFQFCFAGALLVTAAAAYQRLQPDRRVLDALFLQGVAVATLGLVNRFKGVHLVASLAVESLFLLWLAWTMNLRWIAWVGRAAFGVAAVYAWSRWPGWDDPMTWGAIFTALVGLVCARVSKSDAAATSRSALYYATLSVALAMMAVGEHFTRAQCPWAWPALAAAVALVGVLLRTKEIIWLGNLPLVWAHLSFHAGNFGAQRHEWTEAQALMLVAVTFAFGLCFWARFRARGGVTGEVLASEAILPYALAATVAWIATAVCQFPDRWRLAVLGCEGLVLLSAGLWLREPALRWMAILPLAWAHGTYHLWRLNDTPPMLDQPLILIAVTLVFGLIFWAREHADETNPVRERDADNVLWPFAVAAVGVGLLTTVDFVPLHWQPAVFAAEGVALVLSGITVFIWLSLAPFAAATYALAGIRRRRMGPPLEAWGNFALSCLFLLLGARLLRLRRETLALSESSQKFLRAALVTMVTLMVLFGLHKLAMAEYRTVAWAMAGFVLLALGFAVGERPYRVAGLVVLGFSFLRVIFYDLARLDTIYRILSFIGLGAILLVLAFLYAKNRERLSKWL